MNADPFFPFKKNEIDRIQIGRKGHETVLKKNKGIWFVQVREIETRPDLEKTFSFLNTILRIKRFTKISTTTDPKKFGFNGEELKLEIQTESGEIGKLDIGISENGTFVKEPNTGEIWIVKENLNSLLGRGNENFFFFSFFII
nr:PF14238 domain protein [Leptospira interrogans serovar Copenhageni/Icterohaemorrhagiae]